MQGNSFIREIIVISKNNQLIKIGVIINKKGLVSYILTNY